MANIPPGVFLASKIVTCTPFSARKNAAANPEGPLPITATLRSWILECWGLDLDSSMFGGKAFEGPNGHRFVVVVACAARLAQVGADVSGYGRKWVAGQDHRQRLAVLPWAMSQAYSGTSCSAAHSATHGAVMQSNSSSSDATFGRPWGK